MRLIRGARDAGVLLPVAIPLPTRTTVVMSEQNSAMFSGWSLRTPDGMAVPARGGHGSA
jgi:hypothetical protein